MSNVPTNLIPTRITQLPEAPVADPAGYFPIVISGTTYKVQFSQIQGNVEVPASRRVDTGTGLTGGGSLSANLTIAVANGGIGNDQLDTTGVAAGTYGSSTAIPVVTVNDKGRVTGVSTTGISISGYVPDSRQIVAGTGLSGGGNLSANRTLSIDYSSTIPLALGSPSAGSASTPARIDHVHPALDLGDSSQTSGVLPMGRGGTGSALAPVAGAVVVSNGSNISLTSAGSSGQVLFSNGSSPPSFGPTNSLTVGAAGRLIGGDVNKIVYQAATNDTSFVVSPGSANTFLKWNGSSFEWGIIPGIGTVTSVDSTSTVSGLTLSGGPITSAGTFVLSGTLGISGGGTALSAAPANGELLIGNGTDYTLAALTAGTGISVTNATGSITLANTAPDQTVVISGSTNISVTGTYPSFTITNTSTADVVGPAGATSGAISLFDGATGKLLKNSVVTINGSGVISGVNTPNVGTDAANKQYVDDLVSSGIHIHTPVALATSPGSSRTDTYNNGTAGVSATLTSAANGTLVIDGTVASATIRVLIQDCSNPIGNGVYVVTDAGSATTQYVMTRSSDADTAGQQSTQSLDDGSYFFTTGGTSNKGAAWVNTNTGNISFGSTAITFSLFSTSQVYSAGNGLSLTATTFSLETPVSVLNGGTGQSSAPSNGQLLIGNGSNFTVANITAGTAISVTNATGSITLANTAPDQTVVLSGSGIINITGTYPSFSIAATAGGSVSSVDASTTLSGLAFSGGPITNAGVLTLSGTLGISNGGTGASSQSGARTALGLGTMATQDASSVNISGGNVSVGSANITTLTGSNVTFTSGTVTNLSSTSANITTLTGTTFGATATTQLRGASAQITTLTSTSANITTLTGTTFGTTATTQLRGASAQITTATAASLTISSAVQLQSSSPVYFFDTNYFVRASSGLELQSGDFIRLLTNGANERMRLDASGNLLVGTTSSGFNSFGLPLIVGSGSGNTGMTIYSGNASYGSIHFADAVTTGADSYRGYINYNHSTNSMQFATDAAERMRIDSSGNVGIGTTSPGAKLEVNGTLNTYGSTTVVGSGGARVILDTAGDIYAYRAGGTTGVIFLGNSGTRYLYFDGSNYYMPNGQLYVNGQIVLNAGNYGTYVTSLANLSVTSANITTLTGTTFGTTATTQLRGASGQITTLTSTSANITTLTGTTFSDGAGNVRNIPSAGSAKTSVYTLAITDIGEFVEIGSGGGIDVPNGIFSTGNAISIFNNTTGARTISLTITTAYIAGTDADKASVSLATRGLATILFLSNSVCVVSGNVT